MAEEDSFLNKLKSTESVEDMYKNNSHFGTSNNKTLGFVVVGYSDV